MDYEQWHKMFKSIYKEIIRDFGTRTFNDIKSRSEEIKAI